MNSDSKTIVITGASDGIGAAAARSLAGQGHRVVIVGRSPDKTKALADKLGAPFFIADFADLQQVHDLAAQLQGRYRKIDVLANNAGGIMAQRERTVDGHEKTFQVNHLAPFLLTTLLMPTLLSSGARIINTSSQAAQVFGHLDLNDLDAEQTYSPNKVFQRQPSIPASSHRVSRRGLQAGCVSCMRRRSDTSCCHRRKELIRSFG